MPTSCFKTILTSILAKKPFQQRSYLHGFVGIIPNTAPLYKMFSTARLIPLQVS